MKPLSAPELAAWLADPAREAPLLLDVREPWEVATCALAGAVVVPMREIPARLDEIDPARPTVVYCHHGIRSRQVAHFLSSRGFDDVWNLSGGIDAWAREVDPSCPTY
ncbi:MAG TPA: rhodanese-like domain-containing protein [Burkholderiaceae bacterium]|nr:rhodanese-like domain-containing protein [Burkholderiaceae bacterium]